MKGQRTGRKAAAAADDDGDKKQVTKTDSAVKDMCSPINVHKILIFINLKEGISSDVQRATVLENATAYEHFPIFINNR